jgi:hypothetical protein
LKPRFSTSCCAIVSPVPKRIYACDVSLDWFWNNTARQLCEDVGTLRCCSACIVVVWRCCSRVVNGSGARSKDVLLPRGYKRGVGDAYRGCNRLCRERRALELCLVPVPLSASCPLTCAQPPKHNKSRTSGMPFCIWINRPRQKLTEKNDDRDRSQRSGVKQGRCGVLTASRSKLSHAYDVVPGQIVEFAWGASAALWRAWGPLGFPRDRWGSGMPVLELRRTARVLDPLDFEIAFGACFCNT